MTTLDDLKALIDADTNYAAVRTVPVPSAITSAVVYRDADGYYVVSDLAETHKDCWRDWENAVRAVGETWATAEDWTYRVRENGDDLLTLKDVAKRLNISEDTVRRWAKTGAVEAIPLPSAGEYQSYRIRRSTLNELLAKKTPVAKAS